MEKRACRARSSRRPCRGRPSLQFKARTDTGKARLDQEGGIEIHIAAEQPSAAPPENWLPITRRDEDLDITRRIYGPDLEKMKAWKGPRAERTRWASPETLREALGWKRLSRREFVEGVKHSLPPSRG